MTFDRQKFVESVLYVAWKLRDDAAGGAVKLNKVLYYAEFGHMRRFGQPISGARFFKLPEGPAPRALVPVREELIEDGRARLEREPFLGKVQDRLVPTAAPVVELLTDDELHSIDQALQLLEGMNASQVSEMSHREPGWKLVDMKADIPYESAFLADEAILTPAIRAHAARLTAAQGLSA